MWTTTLPQGTAALAGHPIFQLAPLGDVREQMLKVERRILKEVRFAEDGPVEALLWHPEWERTETYRLADPPAAEHDPYHRGEPSGAFGPYWNWIGMTPARVWKDAGGDKDRLVLGSFVHMLERLDRDGNRLPPELAGEPAKDDINALVGLIR